MTDIINLIDQATGCQLDSCGRSLGASPSGDFCSPACQQAWHEEHCDLFPGYTSAERGDGLGTLRIRATRASYTPVGGSLLFRGGRPGFVGVAPEGSPEPTAWVPLHPNCQPTRPAREQWTGELPAGMSLLRGVHAELGQCLRIESGGRGPEDVVVVDVDVFGVLVTPATDPLASQVNRLRANAAEIALVSGTTFAEALRCLVAGLRWAGEAAVAVASMPTDPRTRALEARRNRNTGPARRNRPPRTIKPGGCS